MFGREKKKDWLKPLKTTNLLRGRALRSIPPFLFVFQIKRYSEIKSEDPIICEQCEKYMELIDHNFHDEAEILGECGSCEIY